VSDQEDIKLAVERAAGGAATHAESVPVVETFRGKTVWQGIVEVFSLAKPPSVAYGWIAAGDREPEYVAVLGNPPIKTPLDAVRAWIVSQAKR
jgi:hypothetical protein